MAFYKFNDEPTLNQIRDIASILYALTDTLERFFLDVFLRLVDYTSPLLERTEEISLRYALRSLSKIEEFCLMRGLPWSLDPMPWASESRIKRIAMFQPNLHFKFTETLVSLTALEVYVGAFPRLTGTELFDTPLESLFQAVHATFREVTLVVPSPSDSKSYVAGFRKFMGEVMDSEEAQGQGERRRMLTIAEAERISDDRGSQYVR